ncbi:hemolysin III family protein [Vibrio sp. 10N.286.49.B3]|uniref:PAQR family membrane homeostasis protein TrhA n=1 Tax=Vibrio sp. 10N.286.49.B3 TaxID=1880855 RepID=UPI000C85AF16|nr:hemolysin III family protein [Vibrio sp. 10N.286.49.B3]PMH45387.1 hemolysin III family protein [Vibrio sp. 10N.286.49.B3]
MTESKAMPYSQNEESANSISHGLGVLFGIIALWLLLDKAMLEQVDLLTWFSMASYGLSIIILFLASTLYHSVTSTTLKRQFKTFDHCAIYLLIAGTYTPFLLVALRTPLAIGLMIVIWAIALFGIVMKVAFMQKFERMSLFTYLAMGWLSLIVIYQLYMYVDLNSLILLAIGGVVYSLGVIFYVVDRIPYNHAIWHLFVLAGAVIHFFAIYWYV